MSLNLTLTPIDAMPVPVRGGPGVAGRPNPWIDVLTELRQHPNQPYRLTVEPIDGQDGKAGKAASVAARIRDGGMAGIQAGEFSASGTGGHVSAMYLGQAGIDAYNASEPERQRRKAERAAKVARTKAAKASANGAVPAAEPAAEPVQAPEGVQVAPAAAPATGAW